MKPSGSFKWLGGASEHGVMGMLLKDGRQMRELYFSNLNKSLTCSDDRMLEMSTKVHNSLQCFNTFS